MVASAVALYQKIRTDGISGVKASIGMGYDAKTQALTDLRKASAVLDEDHGRAGTYTATDLSRFPLVVVRYASDSQYCIETIREEAAYHLVGPRGEPVAGGC